jgi:predicted amidohydrolase YtcJ
MMFLKSCFGIAGFVAVALFGVAGSAQTSERQMADLVMTGGNVYTMNESQPRAEAIAIAGGRIVFVGSDAEAAGFVSPDTRIIDLNGKTVFPGFVDAHAHLDGLGKLLVQVNLNGTPSAGAVRQLVLDWQDSTPPGDWIQGRGWDQNDWERKEFPTWADLAGTDGNPVYLRRIDGHAAWVNKTALDRCRITKDTPDPFGGRIIRGRDGEPTGVFIDEAIDLVSDNIPAPSFEDRVLRVKLAIEECQRNGLTGMHDAGIDREGYDVLKYLAARGELNFRVYAMLDADDSTFAVEQIRRGPMLDDDYLKIRALKLYADGALGSRGALLIEPYTDDPSNSGLLQHPREILLGWTVLALQNGIQVCTHAIGDGANRIMLDVYEEALGRVDAVDPRLRIEHAQVIHPDDIARFHRLGVIPAMQPTHATSDMYWAEERLGPDRVKGAYAWRTLIDTGCVIPCGSDFPVEGVNPLWGIYAGVTRQDQKGWPQGGWHPGERMSVAEAVRGFTIHAASSGFAEDFNGTLEPGKFADVTVVDKDIMTIAPVDILKTRVALTVVGGRVVYSMMKDVNAAE